MKINNLEQKIQKNMEILGLTRDEAIELINEDIRIDKMATAGEIDSDLTSTQRQTAKDVRQPEHRTPGFNLDATKKKRPENPERRALINALSGFLSTCGAVKISVPNNEREISFFIDDLNYKLTLSCPRSV